MVSGLINLSDFRSASGRGTEAGVNALPHNEILDCGEDLPIHLGNAISPRLQDLQSRELPSSAVTAYSRREPDLCYDATFQAPWSQE